MTIGELLKKDAMAREWLTRIPEALRDQSSLVTCPAGETLLRKGVRIDAAYLLLKGQIKVLNAMPDGNFYSWLIMDACTFICNLEVLTGSPVNYSQIDAAADCLLLRIPLDAFRDWLRRDIDLLWLVSTDCAKKAHRVSYDMGHGAYKSGFEKVVAYLIKYCGQYPPEAGRATVLEKTRPEMAGEIGVSVKTVNRSLKQLRQEQRVAVCAGKVSVDPAQLAALREIWSQVSP